eukprot:5928634-Pleurochrysis_carterae.AAC.3
MSARVGLTVSARARAHGRVVCVRVCMQTQLAMAFTLCSHLPLEQTRLRRKLLDRQGHALAQRACVHVPSVMRACVHPCMFAHTWCACMLACAKRLTDGR